MTTYKESDKRIRRLEDKRIKMAVKIDKLDKRIMYLKEKEVRRTR